MNGFKWILILSAAMGFAARAEIVLMASSGQNGAVAIQSAIQQLFRERKSIETVKLVGEFSITESVVLPSWTRLDLEEARLTLADGVKAPMIISGDAEEGAHHVEITGGILDGNRQGQGAGDFHGILFMRVEQVRISDLEVRNCSGDGIRLNGRGRHTRDVQLRNLRLMNNARCGLNVMWAMRNVFVSDVIAGGNTEVGVRSDHSEGLFQNICANANVGDGIFIRNIFGGTYNNLTASRNGGIGIHVLGMVCSRGSNWGAHNNSMKQSGEFSDIFFDADSRLSYGISKMTVLSNIIAGPYNEYGPAFEKSAVEFGAGVREGLQISNLMELSSE